MVLLWRNRNACPYLDDGHLRTLNYEDILAEYSLEELLELNNKTPEDCLEYLVENEFIKLPLVFE